MLSCGKVIKCLSKVTRHAHTNHFHRPLKYAGIVGTNNAHYSNDAGDKKVQKPIGTTIKPEECIPPSKPPKPEEQPPPCQAYDSSCPPSCYEFCKPGSGGNGDGNKSGIFNYWKQFLAALVIAGAAVYLVSPSSISQSEKKKSKDIENEDSKKRYKRSKGKIKSPATSNDIPSEIPYLLIGGGTTGFSAFRSIKSRDPKAKVLIITDEEDLPYMRPPLTKGLWMDSSIEINDMVEFTQWNGTKRSLFYEPPEFYTNIKDLMQSEKGGVAAATGWKVKKLDVDNKTAILDDDYEIKYDKCLIATGVSPKKLSIFDSASEEVKKRITTFKTKEDFLQLKNNLDKPDVKKIIIIGGGFLGSELACSLTKYLGEGKKVIQIYKEKFMMAQVLPEYLSEWTTSKAKAEGVNCIPNAEVEDYSFKDGRLFLTLSGGHCVEADQVIVAVGSEANTDLAGPSHLEVNPEIGGFLVNAELEARSNLWVAGDVACFYDVKLGRRRIEHHDHAVTSGRLAGENMTGARKPYLHQSMFWSDLGSEVGFEAIGIVDSSLPTVGVFAKASEKTGENETSETTKEEETTKENIVEKKDDGVCSDDKESEKNRDFGKGVVFYLRDDIVVGIVLWNVFHRISLARQVIAKGAKYDDLNEVAKLFNIHEE